MRAPLSLLTALLLRAGGCAFGSDADPAPAGISEGGAAVTDAHQARTAKIDQSFIEKAMWFGILEIKAADLELRQDSMPSEVTAAARAMIQEHARADFRLEAIARAKGFSVPTDLSERSREQLLELRGVDGKEAEFIKEYDSFLLRSHKDAISLFEDEAARTKDHDLKAYALDLLPKLHDQADEASGLPHAKEAREWWKFW